jgi:photosystem I protein
MAVEYSLTLCFFYKVIQLGEQPMTAKAKKYTPPVANSGKPPYPFRLFWALVLLFGNFVVAAFYFHLIE